MNTESASKFNTGDLVKFQYAENIIDVEVRDVVGDGIYGVIYRRSVEDFELLLAREHCLFVFPDLNELVTI